MCFAARVLPAPIQDVLAWIGTHVAFLLLPQRRRWSREYLEAILDRPVSAVDIWRHIHAFTQTLLAKVRSGLGQKVDVVCEGEDRRTADLLFEGDPLILGTFHVGASDLLGFSIGATGRRVRMVRMQVDNSADLDKLIKIHGDAVGIIWVNNPHEMLLSLRDALQSDATVAIQCDRNEGAEKGECFHFLGEDRLFRISIYRLARLFDRRVMFCVAVPDGSYRRFRVLAHPAFDGSTLSDADFRAAAHAHFQDALNWLEAILRQHPLQWFNFLPLNPVAQPTAKENSQ